MGQTSKWTWIWAVVAVIAIAAAVYLYVYPRTVTVTRTEYEKVPEIRTVRKVQRIYVPVKQVVALEKHEVAQKLDMPWLEARTAAPTGEATDDTMVAGDTLAPIAGEPKDLQVTSTAEIPESRDGYRAVSVLNTETGVTTIVAKEERPPWFRWQNHGAVGLRYGIDQHLANIGDAYVKWDFLRIKDIYFSASANLATDGDAALQLGGEYRW